MFPVPLDRRQACSVVRAPDLRGVVLRSRGEAPVRPEGCTCHSVPVPFERRHAGRVIRTPDHRSIVELFFRSSVNIAFAPFADPPRRGRLTVELQPYLLPSIAFMVHNTLRVHGATLAVSYNHVSRNRLPLSQLVQCACACSELVVQEIPPTLEAFLRCLSALNSGLKSGLKAPTTYSVRIKVLVQAGFG